MTKKIVTSIGIMFMWYIIAVVLCFYFDVAADNTKIFFTCCSVATFLGTVML